MIVGTFQGWGLLGALALGSAFMGVLAGRHRWVRWAGVVVAAVLILGLAVQAVLIWRGEGEDRLIGQAAFLVLFLPAAGVMCLLYGLGFLLGRMLGGRPRARSQGRP